MAKSIGKPQIAGGRTLAKMYQAKGSDGGGKRRKRKRTWYQLRGHRFETRGPIGSELSPPEVE